MQLKITNRTLNDGIVVVDCAGRLVFGEETAALRDRVKALLSEGSRIILNLGEVIAAVWEPWWRSIPRRVMRVERSSLPG